MENLELRLRDGENVEMKINSGEEIELCFRKAPWGTWYFIIWMNGTIVHSSKTFKSMMNKVRKLDERPVLID